MPVSTKASLEEYLRTEYDPDRDFVDGVLLERHKGERTHGELQARIWAFFDARRRQTGFYPFIEQRLQVSPTRFRVPDVCLMGAPKPTEQIFTRPPEVVIEILSREDRVGRIQERIDDYLAFGVGSIWVVDPETRRGWIYTADGNREADEGILRAPAPGIELPLAEIFRMIDAE